MCEGKLDWDESAPIKIPRCSAGRHNANPQLTLYKASMMPQNERMLLSFTYKQGQVEGHRGSCCVPRPRWTLKKVTIPRLELLSALLLARLVSTVWHTLERVPSMTLYTDSRVILYWIIGDKQWKQFLQNLVIEI